MLANELDTESAFRDRTGAHRDINCRDAALSGWTRKFVGEEIVDAIRWAENAFARPDPSSRATLFPGIILSADERSIEGWQAIEEHEATPSRRHVSPRRVSQFERILCWPASYLQDQPREAHALHVWTRSKVRRFAKLDDACRYLGWSRPTAYRALDRALATIAMGLTAENIRRGEH